MKLIPLHHVQPLAANVTGGRSDVTCLQVVTVATDFGSVKASVSVEVTEEALSGAASQQNGALYRFDSSDIDLMV